MSLYSSAAKPDHPLRSPTSRCTHRPLPSLFSTLSLSHLVSSTLYHLSLLCTNTNHNRHIYHWLRRRRSISLPSTSRCSSLQQYCSKNLTQHLSLPLNSFDFLNHQAPIHLTRTPSPLTPSIFTPLFISLPSSCSANRRVCKREFFLQYVSCYELFCI